MEILFSARFEKRFKKLSKKIQEQFEKRIGLFIENSNNPLLRMHSLKGKLVGYRAFSVTGDCRVIFKVINANCIKLIDIGTHNQVYEN